MHVFRRAISLLLSLVLVFAPSLALGRNGTKSHKFEPQDKRSFQKAWQSRQKPTRKIASVAPSARRAPAAASVHGAHGPFKNQKAAIESVFKSLKIKGVHYSYTQIPGEKGTAKAQIIRSKDLESIFVDEYNTGTASRWEIKKGDTTIVADRPYQGQFSHIEITQPRAKSNLKINLQINPDMKTYRLASVRLDPIKVDHEAIAMCASDLSDTSKTSVKTMTKFLEDLQTATSATSIESALTCRLLHNQKMYFDKSCYEGEFASSADDMARALAKVFGTRNTSKPPRMLQCVEQLGFANQSAKMQSDFMSMQETFRYEAMINANWTQASIDKDSDCNRQESLPIWDGNKWTGERIAIDKFSVSFPKTIKCDSSLPTYEAGRTVDGVVILGKPSAWMAKNRGGGSAVDGYAALFLHELMHKTGLPEDPYETLVGNVQQCCADPGIKSQSDFDNNPACQAAARTAKEQMAERANSTEMGIYFPGYGQIYDNVQNRLQQSSRNPSANRFMSDWYQAIQADPKERERLNTMILCEQRNPENTRPCIDAAFDGFKDFNNRYMNNQCKAGVRSGLYTGINCDDFKNIFKTAMTNGKENPPVIVNLSSWTQGTGDSQSPDELRIAPIVISQEPLVVPIDPVKLGEELQRYTAPIVSANMASVDASINRQNRNTPTTRNQVAATTTTPVETTNQPATTTTRTQPVTATRNQPATVRVGGYVPDIDPQTGLEMPRPRTTAEANARSLYLAQYGKTQNQVAARTANQPSTTQRVTNQPTTNQPTTNQPTTNQPTTNQPGFTIGGTSDQQPAVVVADGSTQNPSQLDQPRSDGTGPTDANGNVNPTNDPSSNQPTNYQSNSGSTYTSPSSKPQTTGIRMASNTGSGILAGGSAAPVTNQGYTENAAQISGAVVSASNQLGTTLSNYASNIGTTIASRLEGTAYASAAASRPTASRRPANVPASSRSLASAGGGGLSRLVPARLRAAASGSAKGGDDNDSPQANGKTQSAPQAQGDDSDIVDPLAAPQSKQQMDQRVARDIEAFQGRTFKQQNDVLVGLVNLSPETLSRALARGESSPIIRTLRDNGWVTVPGRNRRLLRSPAGRCYAPDPRKVVVPLPRCE